MIVPSAAAFGRGLASQVFWLSALSGLIALLWRAGLRKILREGL